MIGVVRRSGNATQLEAGELQTIDRQTIIDGCAFAARACSSRSCNAVDEIWLLDREFSTRRSGDGAMQAGRRGAKAALVGAPSESCEVARGSRVSPSCCGRKANLDQLRGLKWNECRAVSILSHFAAAAFGALSRYASRSLGIRSRADSVEPRANPAARSDVRRREATVGTRAEHHVPRDVRRRDPDAGLPRRGAFPRSSASRITCFNGNVGSPHASTSCAPAARRNSARPLGGSRLFAPSSSLGL